MNPSKKKLVAWFSVISLFLLSISIYYVFFHEKIFTVVKDRIYRSSQPSEKFLEKIIQEKGIKTIINLRGIFTEGEWYLKEHEIAKKHNVMLYDIKLSPNDLPQYMSLIKIIDILSTSERPVLVHCYKGIDRAGIVSALALAIEQDSPLAVLKKQFSWRYGVMPFYKSTGPYFFAEYEKWLDKNNKEHSRDTLLAWIRDEYVDNQGNIEFNLGYVNDRIFGKAKKVTLSGDLTDIYIGGWAFDGRTKKPAEGLFVVIDNRTPYKVDFVQDRPDVSRFYELDKHYKTFRVGWHTLLQRSSLIDGCHTISLRVVKDESHKWDIPTEYMLCLEKTDK